MADLEESVEHIVREKEQARARLELLQEMGPDGGWKAVEKLEKQMEEQKREFIKNYQNFLDFLEESIQKEKQHLETIAQLQEKLKETQSLLENNAELERERERNERLERELAEAEERLEEAHEAAEQEFK